MLHVSAELYMKTEGFFGFKIVAACGKSTCWPLGVPGREGLCEQRYAATRNQTVRSTARWTPISFLNQHWLTTTSRLLHAAAAPVDIAVSKGGHHHTLSSPARNKEAEVSRSEAHNNKMSDDNEPSASSSLMDNTKATFLTGLALSGEWVQPFLDEVETPL